MVIAKEEKPETKISYIAEGTVVTPKGFKAAGVHAGLRYVKKDLGVIVCDVPASCAAVYTQNHFQAAPLKVTQQSIATEQKLQAVVVNSACANACTGDRGLKDAYEMRELCARQFGIAPHLVAVASTGVIGEFMPMEKIREGIKKLQPGVLPENAEAFQTAILTTDTVMKKACYQTTIDGKTVTIGGAAKGSGMIHPNMATMLAFITTDANISSPLLQETLRSITDVSFNQITVDGDTSTNDMVIVMASGLAGHKELTPDHPDWENFYEALKKTCEDLAKQIAKDGEGATKLIEVRVNGAKTDDDAKKIAKQIVGSNLVKTAVYGADANWGRIICAIGYAGAMVDPDNVDISIGPISMLKRSEPQPFSEAEASAYLQNDEIVIEVDLHLGSGTGVAWGCDLTYDYVKINASYRT
ncbi:bifunctional ornithine acetyltransferase/N-acetylglutamate synthase [Parageobacillus thermoglucosidasius]|uniref:Arginine biosynthesis bifunctional protein ArgJ n=1 Tax=Parageobacillus thermoglucosidasius TaxID=1426 RepID=A0AAN0YNY9_PARTM|nr:bifunctional ornithine acetyltransferase/N-acetylglutamate synthase [Parageobacillus thermoglucosidasius]ALF09811.1 N-acetylglutamate synthase [Parageobacillus thermoglucosidasius]ANZ29891.1 bifunctional ornithine acetyltransferase/N-acetylglutamate synthase [Parageobacillus thermoglucosidasius]APM80629.1 bifunctional ornithine acetyltransferase/N-acetylglutamate synthase [Parageobacillus thermoglucosidasius]KJX70366.1 N-acetylglutamate synthase [Parageobacillus thermoglucosidasius]RDE21214